MELQISLEELKKRRLFLATPCYGGQCHGLYMKSCLDLQAMMMQYGVEIRFSMLFNESLITRGRNYLVDEFLRAEQFTHLLFIDSDVAFSAEDVITLLAMDKEIAGGPYPKKSINYNAILQAIKGNIEKRKLNPTIPEITAGDLEQIVGEYVFNPVGGTNQFSVLEPLEVMDLGTGFMMIKREVFTKFKEAYPQIHYKPDHGGQKFFDGSRYIEAYFDTYIDSKDSVIGGGSDRYLSEDYAFTQMARKIGCKVWLCPWMKTIHVGTYGFHGNLPAVANLCGRL